VQTRDEVLNRDDFVTLDGPIGRQLCELGPGRRELRTELISDLLACVKATQEIAVQVVELAGLMCLLKLGNEVADRTACLRNDETV
jgi:hypothetical protein